MVPSPEVVFCRSFTTIENSGKRLKPVNARRKCKK